MFINELTNEWIERMNEWIDQRVVVQTRPMIRMIAWQLITTWIGVIHRMKSKTSLFDERWWVSTATLWWSLSFVVPNDWFTLWDCIYNRNADLMVGIGLITESNDNDNCFPLKSWIPGVDLPLNGWVNENCFLFMTPLVIKAMGWWVVSWPVSCR